MHQEQDCIFCKITNGDIPSHRVYEDEHVLAFLDISQVTPGHTLVVPKHHVRNVYTLPEETAAHVFQAVPRIARALKEVTGASGMNLLANAEELAGQTVFHFHVHLIPRLDEFEDGFGAKWIPSTTHTSDDLAQLAANVRSAL